MNPFSFLRLLGTVAGLLVVSACTSSGVSLSDQRGAAQAAGNQPLSGWHWVLPTRASGIQKPVSLQFTDGRVLVDGLCNTMGASYRTEGNKISITNVVSTMKMCSDAAVMQAEQRIGLQLPQATTWQLASTQGQAPQLTLAFADGLSWQMEGEPTDETRYGSAPQTLFLEVQPHTVSCAASGGPATCLQVRTVQYDDRGIKTGHGQWQTVHDTIKGYRHEDGVRAVLRVKRYPLSEAKAGQPAHADVLDMMVESEMVNQK